MEKTAQTLIVNVAGRTNYEVWRNFTHIQAEFPIERVQMIREAQKMLYRANLQYPHSFYKVHLWFGFDAITEDESEGMIEAEGVNISGHQAIVYEDRFALYCESKYDGETAFESQDLKIVDGVVIVLEDGVEEG